MRIHRTLGLFLLSTLILSATIFGQNPASARQKAAKVAHQQAQRRADEESVSRMPDPGADMAFVVALKANIREQADKSSPILKEVERGEALSLVEREPTGTWYHVIHIDSAIEGWIDQSLIVNKFTANKYTAPEFQEEQSEVYSRR